MTTEYPYLYYQEQPPPPKYSVGDIVTLVRLNNDPDHDKYNIFYFDGDLNYSWEGSGPAHEPAMGRLVSVWGTVDEHGIMQDDVTISEDKGTNFLIIEATLHSLEFHMGYYVLVSLTSNKKYKEDYIKVDALMDRFK